MSNEFINIGSANSSPEHFQLRYISISKYEGDWQSLPHTHHFSELFYVLRGEGAFYIENEKVPVKTDDLVIINPYVEHTEKTLPNDPMEYIVFGVEGLAFSFSGAGQDNPKGYSFYSYGSDKKQFINFAQLMMQEFRDKLPGLNRCATDCFSAPGIYFPEAEPVRHLRLLLPIIQGMCSGETLYRLQLFPEHYFGFPGGDHAYQQILSGTLLYRMCRTVSDQLPDRPETGSL